MELSIIVCTYNREIHLPNALQSLKNQTLEKKLFEIIVVDNCSTDTTATICNNFATQNPELQFIYHRNPQNMGLSFSRNKGFELSSGKIIVYLDDDAIAQPTYASNYLENFRKYPLYDAMGGAVTPLYSGGCEPVWMSKYLRLLVAHVDYGTHFANFKKKYPVGCNMAFRREILSAFGGFNVALSRGDEKYLFMKLKKAGKKILYAPNVAVQHNIQSDRLSFAHIKKLNLSTGISERIRLKSEPLWETLVKPLEYLFKLGAAFVLGFGFVVQGKSIKAKFLIASMWYILLGFFKKNN